MTPLPCRLWYCRNVPIEMLKSSPTLGENKAPWFEKLVEDTKINGLASPLMVCNGHDGGIERQFPMRVTCGMNRLQALRKLGWTTVPCLVSHNIPEGVPGVELRTREEGQAYLRDGFLCIIKSGVRVNQTVHPESEKYPQTEGRYWPEEPNG